MQKILISEFNSTAVLSKSTKPVLIIVRGISGSGKSTYTNELKGYWNDFRRDTVLTVCSTDNFFIDVHGNYSFDPSRLVEYHDLNLRESKELMLRGYDVVVDNQNVIFAHVKPYLEYAKERDYMVRVVTIHKDYSESELEDLAKRNKHGVPLHAIKRNNEMFESHEVFCKSVKELFS